MLSFTVPDIVKTDVQWCGLNSNWEKWIDRFIMTALMEKPSYESLLELDDT